jgi:cyclophilin family peptidyl-prolyl cis-trans isomerase
MKATETERAEVNMRVFTFCVAVLLTPAMACSKNTVVLETSEGDITIRCHTDKAPISCKNFFAYIDAGFYDGTIFHRVIPDFMIQGGGFTETLQKKETREPIKNEADNGLKNKRGTLAMARTGVVDSATAQFFINVKDNAFLDHRGQDPRSFGYAVFAEVTSGMDIVDKIENVATLCPSKGPDARKPCEAPLPPNMRDVPAKPVIIKKAYRK